jgi:hypothetical protein
MGLKTHFFSPMLKSTRNRDREWKQQRSEKFQVMEATTTFGFGIGAAHNIKVHVRFSSQDGSRDTTDNKKCRSIAQGVCASSRGKTDKVNGMNG